MELLGFNKTDVCESVEANVVVASVVVLDSISVVCVRLVEGGVLLAVGGLLLVEGGMLLVTVLHRLVWCFWLHFLQRL